MYKCKYLYYYEGFCSSTMEYEGLGKAQGTHQKKPTLGKNLRKKYNVYTTGLYVFFSC